MTATDPTVGFATTARNADLSDIVGVLKTQQAHKFDVVASADKLTSVAGMMVVEGTDMILDDAGKLSEGTGWFRPTKVADDQMAEKLGIPSAYLQKLRENGRVDLLDANVNGWLQGTPHVAMLAGKRVKWADSPGFGEQDGRNFLLRCFRGDAPDSDGILRAFLSDKYQCIEHLDTLMTILSGIEAAGVEAHVYSCDLTDRRLHVRFFAPQVEVLAPVLLRGYRDPFDGLPNERRAAARAHGWLAPDDRPVVFAGFRASNSETGGGALSITPEIVVKLCTNGATVTRDMLRRVHLGGQLEEGVISWSADTQRKALELVHAQTRDAVTGFLNVEYITKVVEEIESKAGAPVDKPAETLKVIGKQLQFSDQQIDGILDHFIRGGQMTAGGVMNAVTSYAQMVPDGDEAARMADVSLRALDLAAK